MTGLVGGLVLPALLIGGLGWLVPRLLGLAWPEGAGPLLLLALAATLLMAVLAAGVFVLLYAWQGVPVGALFEPGLAAGLLHFGRLSLLSALVWAPVLVLTVAGLPKRWRRATW